MNQYTVKTEADKDAIIEQATQVCRWIGWLEMAAREFPLESPLSAVSRMKAMIEASTGAIIDQYT